MNENLGIFEALQARRVQYARFIAPPNRVYSAPHYAAVISDVPAPVPAEEIVLTFAQRIAQIRQITLQQKIGVVPDPDLKTSAILNAVATAFEVTLYALYEPSRTRRSSRPRWAVMKIMRDYKAMSTSRIGFSVGRKDHTTTMYGLLRAADLYESDPDWRARYDHALTLLGKLGATAIMQETGR